MSVAVFLFFFFFQAEDGIRDLYETGVQTCALPISTTSHWPSGAQAKSSTSCIVSVSFCASPPIRFNSQTWVLPSLRAERNARYLPSGLQRGCDDEDRKSTRLNSSHVEISYAVFCLK